MAYELTFHPTPEGPAGEYTVQKLTAMIETFASKLEKQSPVQRIEVTFDDAKNPVGKTVASEVRVRVHLFSGKSYVAKAEQFVAKVKHVGVETSVRDALKELAEQIRRDHHQYPGGA